LVPNQFNDQVEQMMNAFVDSFLQDIQNGEYDEILSEFTNGLSTDYRPTYVDSKQISILFVQSVYYAGAAHPLPFSQTINYDLWKDRALRLEDLFVENTDYLARISEYATNDLRQQGVLEWEEGASPSVDNFSNWNITLEGLQFTFDPYQVAPYAAGFQEVLIPYEVIRDILREGGPVPPLDYE
jgi:peptidoglycan-N-acetylglucosamine deacetylase